MTTPLPPSTLTISIATGSDGTVNLSNDILLVKPALLYADRVELTGFTAQIMLEMEQLTSLPIEQKLEFFVRTHPMVKSSYERSRLLSKIQKYHSIASMSRAERRRQYTKEQQQDWQRARREYEAWSKHLETTWDEELAPQLIAKMEAAGAPELRSAIAAGLLQITEISFSENLDEYMDQFYSLVVGLLEDSEKYPLFDSQVSGIVRAAINEGYTKPSRLAERRAVEISASADFMSTLPSFAGATIREILDVRQELEPFLSPFRRALYEIRERIQAPAFTAELANEIDEIRKREIVPLVQEIENAVEQNSFLQNLSQVVEREGVRSIVPTGLVSTFSLNLQPGNVVLASILSTAVFGADLSRKALAQKREMAEEIEHQAMFVLYELERQTSH